VNKSRGGETTSGGLRRLDNALEGNVKVLVVELGGNDGFQGVPVETVRRNLMTIVERAKARGITVLLAQMETPPSRGLQYSIAFHRLYGEIATEQKITLIPFILADVYGRRDLTRDGIHPNREGARRIADTVWGSLEPVLVKG
jgi:acyl-CoA thioesterase I